VAENRTFPSPIPRQIYGSGIVVVMKDQGGDIAAAMKLATEKLTKSPGHGKMPKAFHVVLYFATGVTPKLLVPKPVPVKLVEKAPERIEKPVSKGGRRR